MSAVKIDNDENNLYIEFNWNIDYLEEISPNIESMLIDDKNQEYPLDIIEDNIILPLEFLKNKKYAKIKMYCSTDSFKKESFLRNNRRGNVNINDINLEIGIGINGMLFINSRNVNQNEIIIEDITFDGQHFIFNGSTEFDIKDVTIENVINLKKFTYPINFNNNHFDFKIPYSEIIKFPIKKWELKGDYLMGLTRPFNFFRNHDEIIFSNQRNIILIEDDVYDIFEKLNKLDENLNSATQRNRELTDDSTIFKENNSKLKTKNNKLKKRNNELKDNNKRLNEKNKKLKNKNKKLSNIIGEYKSRKIIRIADKFKL